MLTERFNTALTYAAIAHREQRRKGSDTPYVAHLLSVCSLVLEHGGDEDQAIAALLHDVVEDQGGKPRLAEVRAQFGERVAAIVAACSDTDVMPKPPWKARKLAYIEALKHHGPDSWLVSCADKVHNADSILRDHRILGEAVWDRFTGGKDGTLWYYRTLALEFQRLMPGPLAQTLDDIVTRLVAEAGI
ncbi:MAG: HD domain-containing protein [Gammaproteobacteria bacterium]